MDSPFTKWYCDVCGECIEDVKDGCVSWDKFGKYVFHLTHWKACKPKENTSSMPLRCFVGGDGLTYTLALLSKGPIALGGEDHQIRYMPDLNSYVDFIRRMQTPFYEEARILFGNESLIDDFSDSNEHMPYLSSVLEGIIRKYGENNEELED